VLLIISSIRSLNSLELLSNIKGISLKLKGKFLKYPLNSAPVLIKLTIVEWLELINLAKVFTEGRMMTHFLNEL